ncbi:DUF4878 domain-containing protein [Nocardia sp. NPDC051030]|uniref:Rv0361 family membrane protein n=1 Tax=Nocardia sp. NPDC051030 TaxID=3155162 RepID=UPI0034261C26
MSDVEEKPERIDQGETRTMLPFLVAAGVIVLVVIGIVIAALVSPAEKNLTDSNRLAIAARNFTESGSGTDRFDKATACPGFDDKRSPLNIPDQTGQKFDLVKVTDTTIDGDKATAAVTVRADGRENTSTWHFTKTDNTWLVCNAG